MKRMVASWGQARRFFAWLLLSGKLWAGRSLVIWVLCSGPWVLGAQARLQMEDGSFLPLTSTFPQIQFLENTPQRTVVIGHTAKTDAFFVMDSFHGQRSSQDLEVVLRSATGIESLTLVRQPGVVDQDFRAQVFKLEDAGGLTGAWAQAGQRNLKDGWALFCLVASEDVFPEVQNDFWRTVFGYQPGHRVELGAGGFSAGHVLVAIFLLIINLVCLWLAFKTYASMSSQGQEIVEDLDEFYFPDTNLEREPGENQP